MSSAAIFWKIPPVISQNLIWLEKTCFPHCGPVSPCWDITGLDNVLSSCSDICQISMSFQESNVYFCKIENFPNREINEQSFSNPTPGPPPQRQPHPTHPTHTHQLLFAIPSIAARSLDEVPLLLLLEGSAFWPDNRRLQGRQGLELCEHLLRGTFLGHLLAVTLCLWHETIHRAACHEGSHVRWAWLTDYLVE